jgi:uncharacterized protein YycO
MKPRIFLLLIAAATVSASEYVKQEGDIVFQSSPLNMLVKVIEGCTDSPLSHCGILHHIDGKWRVVEARGNVHETDYDQWVKTGREGHLAVYRLKPIYSDKIADMIASAQMHAGKPYDAKFEMDDEKLYCSELVYKAFKSATGEELGKLQKLKELSWEPWKEAIAAIEGGEVPLEREMITPKALSEAEQLDVVYDDFPKK